MALSLLGNPDVIFLDEPTAGLDVEGRAALHDEIRKLSDKGKTIVLASHDMAEVETLSSRIGILSKGKMSFLGTVSELSDKMGKLYTVRIRTENGEETYRCEDIRKTMYEILRKCEIKNSDIRDIKVERGTLEEHLINISRGNQP